MKFLMMIVMIFLFTLPLSAHAGTCAGPAVGPGGCPDTPPNQPAGPPELCLPGGCTPVSYFWHGDFVTAQATLPDGYPVAGVIGPCLSPDRSQCPGILNQAFSAMQINALQAHRARRY